MHLSSLFSFWVIPLVVWDLSVNTENLIELLIFVNIMLLWMLIIMWSVFLFIPSGLGIMFFMIMPPLMWIFWNPISFFLSVRQLCCLQVGCFVPLWTKISFATFSNSSKLTQAKVNIFFLLFNCIYFTLSATLPAALLVFPELMNLFAFHLLLVAEGFVPV